MWLGCEYLRFYGIAKEQHDILCFDIRTKQDIIDFFMDLKYGDYDTYVNSIRRFPEYKLFDIHIINQKMKLSMKKYNDWRNENKTLCEWHDMSM